MKLFDRLRRSPRETQVKAIAEQIAASACHAVWHRVSGRIGLMGTNEARGYIRARAAAVVAREVDIALAHDRQLRESKRTRITELTNEIVIRLIMSQSRVAQLATVPVRRAA